MSAITLKDVADQAGITYNVARSLERQGLIAREGGSFPPAAVLVAIAAPLASALGYSPDQVLALARAIPAYLLHDQSKLLLIPKDGTPRLHDPFQGPPALQSPTLCIPLTVPGTGQ